MDDNLARVIMVAVISLSIAVSMIANAVARVVSARRRKELPDASLSRLEDRLERMEQAIDAIATEVERVAEGQRFASRLIAERQVEPKP